VRRVLFIFTTVCGFCAVDAFAADKSQYHLFNPTPRELMRELSTDRPDTTESPYTVDAGHVQVEMSFLEYARDRSSDSVSVAPMNLKIGLTNSTDLQLVLQPYLHVDDGGGTLDGFGDTQLRLKINLWGNDGGNTALAFMPFVQFPTGEDDLSSDEVEGGLIVPFSINLPNEFSLTTMLELDVLEGGDRVDLVHTIALGREIAGPLGGFVEYVGVLPLDANDGEEDYLASAACGLTYGIGADVQLDAAVQFGLSDEADDFTVLAGISFRF
jgi:hypothetical protein